MDSVLLYTTHIKVLPDTVMARLMGCKDREYFKATEEEKKNVEVKFQ